MLQPEFTACDSFIHIIEEFYIGVSSDIYKLGLILIIIVNLEKNK